MIPPQAEKTSHKDSGTENPISGTYVPEIFFIVR